jgi:hypothetical protein
MSYTGHRYGYIPLNPTGSSPPLAAILLAGLLIVPLIVIAATTASRRATYGRSSACGYDTLLRCPSSANSFDQPIKSTFRPIYVRTITQVPFKAIERSSNARETMVRVEPSSNVIMRDRPPAWGTGEHIQALQMGDIRLYLLHRLYAGSSLIVIFR